MPKETQKKAEETIMQSLVFVRDLNLNGENPFTLTPDAGARAEIAGMLGLLALKKLRFAGSFSPLGKSDWALTAKLGATVVQSCVITNDPVTTRLDTEVRRTFIKNQPDQPEQAEVEFDGDDENESLKSEIDLAALMTEALALALPDYPRSPGAVLEESVFSPPGTAPLRETDIKPFASLAKLRDKLKD